VQQAAFLRLNVAQPVFTELPILFFFLMLPEVLISQTEEGQSEAPVYLSGEILLNNRN
jgi:hypothetical protein